MESAAACAESSEEKVLLSMKFSIIVPVYNVAPYLRECLGSIADAIELCKSKSAECRAEVEVICVDDGSTDGSGAILDEYAAKNAQIKVVHKPNGGVSSARNRGLEEAKGEWIGFVDADDVVCSAWFDYALKIIELNPDADMITFGQDSFDESGVVSSRPAIDPMMCGFTQTLYKRAVFGRIRFPSYGIGEDRVFTMRCLSVSEKNVLVPDVMYHYRQSAGSAMHRRRTLRLHMHSFLNSILACYAMFKVKRMSLRWRLRFVAGVWYAFVRLLGGVFGR